MDWSLLCKTTSHPTLLKSRQHIRPLTQLARRSVSCRAAAVTQQQDVIQLGRSGVEVTSVGVGAWSWGDRTGYWGFNREYGKEDNRSAYQAIISSGITFIDTAEAYGFGKSEEFLGEFMRQTGSQPVIATKFAPYPWRFTSNSVEIALKGSLNRLQLDQAGVYMIHWPGSLINAFSNDAFVAGLANVHKLGLAKAVGVSNFTEDRLRRAHRVLADQGISLSHNQVQYSLLYRTPERNGVLQACQELGVTLMAYSPLAQGLLTGKYTVGGPKVAGPRAAYFSDDRLRELQPLLGLMAELGQQHGGKSPAQVALNWIMCKGCLPIPGAKNARQVEELAGAMGWRLAPEEVAALDKASDKLSSTPGAPFEKW